MKFISEPRVLQRYTYILGLVGHVPHRRCRPVLPASISGVANTGAKIQIAIGGFSLQPGEFGRLALAVFFAGYLVTKRDVLTLAGRRVLGIDLPRGRDLGPIVDRSGRISLLLLVFESDVGHERGLHGPVRRHALHRHLADKLAADRLRHVHRRRAAGTAKLFSHVGARFDIWLHPFTPANVKGNACTSSSRGLYGMANGGLLGKGLGAGQPYLDPAGAKRLHLHRLRRGDRAGRADGAAA